MRKSHLSILLLGISLSGFAQHTCYDFKNAFVAAAVPNKDHSALSDTFDIEHTHLEYDFTQLPSNQLIAKASLNVKMLQATSAFRFELDNFTIDSIHINQANVPVSTNGDFRVASGLPSSWTVGNNALVEVWYHGSMPADPSGWGGWHHNAPYFFNLGVGFGVNPHSYGRSMFPAFDNFVEHSTYSFEIMTELPRRAYANGLRTNMFSVNGDTIMQEWSCSTPISAYLVSVAVSDYQELERTIQTNNGTIPYLILARANDTTNAKSSFTHMQGIMDSYEEFFGDYVWDKVGYALTTQGAMEHATSIHLPRTLADGTYNGERIIAHEHAHHWWGNLITCEKAEDMWINEGMAEFSSHLFLEDVYSRERYMTAVRGNQLQVLHYAHAQDGGYLALNGVDHGTTYGMHVYNKGAWIGHNLRGYLGDSLYKSAVANIFTNHAHQNATTATFEQWLTQESGINMSGFFADWITSAGQVAISVDSVSYSGSGSSYSAVVGVSQHRKERTNYLSDAPMVLTFHSSDQTSTFSVAVRVNQPSQTYSVSNIPFAPAYVTVNEGEEYLVGSTYELVRGNGFNIYNLDACLARLTVNTSTDDHEIYMEQHWAGPENGSSIARLSTGRFWTIRGTWSGDFDAEMRIFYDGRAASGALDADLVGTTEDSLVVLWRPDASYDWQLYPHFTKNTMGSSTNAFGYVTLTEILPGDFVFANAPEDIGMEEPETERETLRIYPNPSSGEVIVDQYSIAVEATQLELLDLQGKSMYQAEWGLNIGWNQFRIPTLSLPSGTYIVKTSAGEERIVVAGY